MSKGNKSASILSAISHIKIAIMYFEDACRTFKGVRGESLSKNCINRLNLTLQQITTNPSFDDATRQGFREAIKADVLAIPSLIEKISLLKPEAMEAIEALVDTIINGEELTIEAK